ncbi:6-phospho-3-hexuloisomerase [Orbus mooreae]|uniref:6-phospho-3-hexuloisomerase n=1 Tax=Orbus mooreae TaxID=3074107 RepID=UPI00370D7F5F
MDNIFKIIKEIGQLSEKIDSQQVKLLIQSIRQSKHIFLTGAGRSGVVINAFANRLMHLGYSVSVVGEITSPHSKPQDLMLIGSGSGETIRLVEQAKLAKANHIKLVLITANANSTLAKLADCVVIIPFDNHQSVQPMGTLFEQTSFLLYDSIILSLMSAQGETSRSMKQRHADIE